MNPTPTPHNAQPPQWRKITPEDPPRFPCKMRATRTDGTPYERAHVIDSGEMMRAGEALGVEFHSWRPLQSTAPGDGPTNFDTVAEGGVAPDTNGLSGDAGSTPAGIASLSSHAGPAETATPEVEAELVVGTIILHNGQAAGQMVPADFARRLERERDQARAQLKSMTDQFFAVSGQLGEAIERHETAQYFKEDGDKAFNALRDEHNALLERLKTESQTARASLKEATRKYQDGLDCVPFCELAAAMERLLAHLAQSGSPGAGVKGEDKP